LKLTGAPNYKKGTPLELSPKVAMGEKGEVCSKKIEVIPREKSKWFPG